MRPELISLDDLRELPSNPRHKHDLETIEASATKFGFIVRVIVNETTGHLVSGHGRLAYLHGLRGRGESPPEHVIEEGLKWLVPAEVVEIAAEDEWDFAVAVDQAGEGARWKKDVLREKLAEVDDGSRLRSMGLTRDRLDRSLRKRASGGKKSSRRRAVKCPDCGHEFTPTRG